VSEGASASGSHLAATQEAEIRRITVGDSILKKILSQKRAGGMTQGTGSALEKKKSL
jgi:hypothetical protein